jgi:hypothetical protein
MDEQISFIFDGKFASENRMDFYEAARFQYSAARLMVKLDNFRRKGEFPAKITYKNTPDLLLLPPRPGSFGLDVIGPALAVVGPLLIEVPLSAMLSYVIDRVFGSADDDTIRQALATQRELVETFDRAIAGHDDTMDRTLEMLQDRIERDDFLNDQVRALYERMIADQQRQLELAQFRDQFRRINPDQEADLITMSAPLLKEMNVPLRRSANKIIVRSVKDGDRRDILRADKSMADAVELAVVDRHITTIDINIVQFNKQSGWGKFENEEWEGNPPFVVPGDILEDARETIVNAMKEDLVEVDCFFVRSPAGIPQRIIVIDIRYLEEI